MAVAIDQPVANFEAPATSGQTVSLAALKGKQVVIYFYRRTAPRAAPPKARAFVINTPRSRPPTPRCSASPAMA